MVTNLIESCGTWAPLASLGLFLAASLLMIWRLEALSARGFEGTALGTLVMPYCSGAGNLLFVVILARTGGPGREAFVNSLVNNVTNLTLLLGLPAVLWGSRIVETDTKGTKQRAEQHVNRLYLLLTLCAALFFTAVTWALSQDGTLDRGDGLVLVGLFLFWQCVAVFDVLKANTQKRQGLPPSLPIEAVLLAACTYVLYVSIEWLVAWISSGNAGFLKTEYLGWLSGWLMVLPNALLALYYGKRGRPDVVYTSQVGDGHICIPLALGLFAVIRPMDIPDFLNLGVAILCGAVMVHLILVAWLGRVPRLVGAALAASYAVFLVLGLA